MNYIKIITLFLLFTFASADEDIKKLFNDSNINGTLVLSSLENKQSYIYNKQRAKKRYLPASTFKILNSLITLDEKIIKDEKEIIKWDGKKRGYSPWNQDHTLKSAIAVSCVWCYQTFAKKIGNIKYLDYLQKVDYGNQLTGPDVTTFWLEGDIKISTIEQIDFLKKLYKNTLPFSQRAMDITKEILTVETNDKYTIKAKSGWTGDLGWYVGYVQTKDNIWFFALNADINKNTLKYRKQIVMDTLKIKDII